MSYMPNSKNHPALRLTFDLLKGIKKNPAFPPTLEINP